MLSDRTLALLLRSPRSRAMWGDLAHATVAGLVLVLCVAWLAYYAVLARAMVEQYHLNDFGKFYYAARLFLAGEDMYGPNPATSMYVGPGLEHEFLNVNPPHFHLLLLPLAPLAPMTALVIWAIASLAALAFCLRLIVRELGVRLTPARVLWSALALLSFAATGAVVITGQLSFFLMVPVTLAWVNARRARWPHAGVWMGLAMSVKPFLLIFVPYFLLRRQWRAAGYAVVTVAAAFGVGRAVFGMEAHEGWGRALAGTDWPWAAMNGSLLGMLSRSLRPSPYFTPAWLAPELVRPLWLTGALAILSSTLWVSVRDRSDSSVDRGYALLLLGSLLVSPLGWVYYLWLPLGPVAALAAAWASRRVTDRLLGWRNLILGLAVPGLVCPLILTTALQPSPWATVSMGSAYFWGTTFLWCALAIDRFADGRRVPLRHHDVAVAAG
jgi:alpha-1,2-mannosyltransferase